MSEVGVRYAMVISDGYRKWVEAGGYGFDPLELRDAAFECEHGSLPLDKRPGCDCFEKWAA